MASRKEQELLCNNLRKWFNILSYRITDTELKVITKNGRNLEFWRIIQKLVLPGDDIRSIRSKLASYQRKQEYNNAKQSVLDLQKQKEDILIKISASKARSSQSKADMSALKTKMKSGANNKTDKLQALSTATMKDMMHKALTSHYQNIQQKFDKTSESLTSVTSRRTHIVESVEESPGLVMSGGRGAFETECVRSVYTVLSQIKTYLHQHISESSQDSNTKMALWKDAAQIHDKYSPSEILSAIKSISGEQATSLQNGAETMSFEKDLKKLNFEIINGAIVSNGSNNNTERTLEQHAVELQNQVSKGYLAMLDLRNQSRNLQKSLNTLQMEVDSKVQLQSLSTQEKHALSALIKFKIRESELDSKKEVLRKELQRLQDEKDTATKQKVQTLKTHKHIMDFKKNQEQKQAVIKALVGQTDSLKNALNSQKTSIGHCIKDKLEPSKTVILSRLDSVKSYPDVLSSTLAKIPLDRLHLSTFPSGTVPIADLSIYQFENSSAYHRLLTKTSLPLHLDSESFLNHVSSMVVKVHSENMTFQVLKNILESSQSSVSNGTEFYDSLQNTLFNFDAFISENILKIKRHEQKLQTSMKKASSIGRMIQTFSEQPAQHLVPWFTVGDLHLKEYQEKWLVRSSMTNSVVSDANLFSLSNLHSIEPNE